MTLRIRPARPEDDAVIWGILEPIFRAGETYCQPRDITRADALAYWSGAPHTVHVAADAAGILGTYYLCPNQPRGGGGEHVANAGFATSDAAQGRGVARAMLAHSLDTARAQGFLAMQFNFVVETNLRAIDLWRAHGFAEVGRLPRAFRHPVQGPVDALVMSRAL